MTYEVLHRPSDNRDPVRYRSGDIGISCSDSEDFSVKPWEHAKGSMKRWGGRENDYLAIHDFLDSSKAHFPDMRHRALLHSSFGIFICERIFGTNIQNSDGKLVSVRDVAEKHVLEDMGTIPTVQDYLQHLPMLDWLGGPKRKKGEPILVD